MLSSQFSLGRPTTTTPLNTLLYGLVSPDNRPVS